MLVFIFRTVIIYVLITFTMRLLGKRQIGEMQPAELVVTFLLSEIFSIPMQDNSIPLMSMIVPVFLITGLEILSSVLSLKSIRFRHLMQGNSVVLISRGKLDQKQLKALRMTTDDLLEALRKKDVFDISNVEYAIVETDGSVSVMLNSSEQTVKSKDMNLNLPEAELPAVVIADGRLIEKNFQLCNTDKNKIAKLLRNKKVEVSEVMLLTVDSQGNSNLIRKQGDL